MEIIEEFILRTGHTCLYNITPLDNIPSILVHGILSHDKAQDLKHSSVADLNVQEIRDNVRVTENKLLHEYANLYFDARNPMMYKIRANASNLCVLHIDPCVLAQKETVVSDGNAASSWSRFYNPKEALHILNFNEVYQSDWRNADYGKYCRFKSRKCAEVLVLGCVPPLYIVGASVVNEQAISCLKSMGFTQQIILEPTMFFDSSIG